MHTFGKKSAFLLALISAGVFAVASMGGGNKKSKVVKNDFVTVRTTSGFTLKAGPIFKNSRILSYERSEHAVNVNSVLTYQKGNTTFILPYRQRMAVNCSTNPASSLQVFNLRLRMHK
jgi:hypothetical protein